MNAFGAWTPPSYSRENQKAYSARDGEIVWNFKYVKVNEKKQLKSKSLIDIRFVKS